MPHTQGPKSNDRIVATSSSSNLIIAHDYADWFRLQGLDSVEALFGVSGDAALSKPGLDAWRERLRLTIPCGNEERTFYIKRYARPPAQAVREVRRLGFGVRTMAGVEWFWLHRLLRRGVRCARPVALGEEFERDLEQRSVLVLEAVPGASLETWAGRWSVCDRETIRSLIGPLAKLARDLHALGYFHRDLYLSHVFYDADAPCEESLCLIDLARMIQPSWNQQRWTIKDLAALNYSAPRGLIANTDRVRFLKAYLGVGRLERSARRLLYRVVGKTQSIARHDRRRRLRWSNAPKTAATVTRL